MTIVETPTPACSARPAGAKITTLVMHYTAIESRADVVEGFMHPANEKSAHYVVDLDGTVIRMVPEAKKAWHAGVSTWNGADDVNRVSVGIEVVNFGWADRTGPNGELQRRDRVGNGFVTRTASAPAAAVVDRRSAWANYRWAAYPEVQTVAVLALVRDIVRRNGIDPTFVVGHEHIAPGRKADPGPGFPWARVATTLADLPAAEAWVARAVQSHAVRLGYGDSLGAAGVDGDRGKGTDKAVARIVKQHGKAYALPAATDRRAFAEALRRIPG